MAIVQAQNGRGEGRTAWPGMLDRFIGRGFHLVERNLIAISLCGAVGMPLYYFIWNDLFPQPYENLTLRLIGAALCLPLVFWNTWPQSLRRFAPYYWYATVIYVLPFFFTYMTLKNDFTAVWLASFISALFLLVILVDWLNLISLTALGMALGWIAFAVSGNEVSDPTVYLQLMPIVFFVLIVGTVFGYRTEMLRQERMDAMLTAGRNLSHELRSPLLGIRTSTISLSQYLPLLLKTYEAAEARGLAVEDIPQAHRTILRHCLDRLQGETLQANTIVEMLLRNSGGVEINEAEFSVFSMADCVRAAIARYPFLSEKERKLVKAQLTSDFSFYGSESAMIYVVLSLLKNALLSISRHGRGEVCITLAPGPKRNVLLIAETSGAAFVSDRSARFFDGEEILNAESGTGPALRYVRRAIQSFKGGLSIRAASGRQTEIMISLPQRKT
ncbi:MAG: hypothetical protein AAFW81_10980 [Pseudomonadota bacterium]